MATLVRFLKEKDGEGVFAFFPQLRFNKRLYGNDVKLCYSQIGQHSSCSLEYTRECEIAAPSEYYELKEELKAIGYDLKVV